MTEPMKTEDELDRYIWKAYQNIPTYSSNPEDYLAPIRILIQREASAERERIKNAIRELPVSRVGFSDWEYLVKSDVLKLIDSL